MCAPQGRDASTAVGRDAGLWPSPGQWGMDGNGVDDECHVSCLFIFVVCVKVAKWKTQCQCGTENSQNDERRGAMSSYEKKTAGTTICATRYETIYGESQQKAKFVSVTSVRRPSQPAQGERMPITITEPGTYDAYSLLVDTFQLRMRTEGHEKQDDMSNEREKGQAGVRRFIATNEHGMVVGWMTLKTQDADLKIEGICADPNKANSPGASKALVTKAVNCSFQSGKAALLR
jgi:hypothetical protein